jgi:hypothetical protein
MGTAVDLTPFFANVGRIADALERIADGLGETREPDYEPATGELPEWMKPLAALTQVKLEPKILLSPAAAILPAAVEPTPEAEIEERLPEAPPAPDPLDATIIEIFEGGTTTLNGIATELNNRGIKTERGGKFYAATLVKTFDRLGLKSSGGSFRSMRTPDASPPAKGSFVENFGTIPTRRKRSLPPPPAGKTEQDLIAEVIAAGRVTKLPACIDSSGYNHATGKEA